MTCYLATVASPLPCSGPWQAEALALGLLALGLTLFVLISPWGDRA
jgi:hypothetical protein